MFFQLDYYIKEVIKEEEVGEFVRVEIVEECWGNVEQRKRVFDKDEWRRIKNSKYYVA